MGKPAVESKSRNSRKEDGVSFNDISQVVNKDYEILNTFLFKYSDRLKGLGKSSDSAHASWVKRNGKTDI